ncbi:CdvA-like protein, partial [Candidatus Bathyarchaeota archaeon]|nr:CdvA-like protein [Candidatus Bathyarchaeota archaeon]
LESQLSSLELLLASLEIHHAAGDVDDETYEKENKAILLGLEATKRELNDIRNALQGSIEKTTAEKPEPVEAEKPPTEQEKPAFEREEKSVEESKIATEPSEHISTVSTSEESQTDTETYTYGSNESTWETETSTEY